MDGLRVCTAILGVIIYSVGFIGNFLSLLLFTQKELRCISTGLLFLMLNIMNTIHLLSLVVDFLDSIFQIQVLPSSIFRCQFIYWLQNATRTMSCFLATTISVDRFLRSEYPVKSRIWCTTKNTLKLALIYAMFSILLYAFFFYPLNIFDENGFCLFSSNMIFRIFTINVMPPIRLLFTMIILFGIMLGCGGRTIFNIRQSRKRIAQQTTTQNGTLATIATIVIAQISKAASIKNEQGRRKLAIDQMLLLLIIANVVVYVLTQMPFNIYAIYYGYSSTVNYAAYSLVQAFLLMCGSIYFGVGFYLFCGASSQLRKQFLTKIETFLTCCSSPQGPVSTIRNT